MSKFLVLYSSQTGNTKQVAEAIAACLPRETACLPLAEAPNSFAEFDCVFLGFWVDRSKADAKTLEILPRLDAKNVALFMTLGASPASPHAAKCMDETAKLLPPGTVCQGTFICQGKIDPKVIEMMYKMFPPGSPHGQSPERDALHAEAAKHPNPTDLANAQNFANEVLLKL